LSETDFSENLMKTCYKKERCERENVNIFLTEWFTIFFPNPSITTNNLSKMA